MHISYLDKLAHISPGYPFRGSLSEDPDGDALVLRMGDVDPDSGAAWDGLIQVALKGRRCPDWLRDDDIVFLAKGNRNYATLLKHVPPKVVASPQFFVLRADTDVIDPSFLAWQMNQRHAKRYFKAEAEGSTSISIRKSVLAALPIMLPSSVEQLRMMQVVNCAQEQLKVIQCIERNQRTLLDTLARQLLYKVENHS